MATINATLTNDQRRDVLVDEVLGELTNIRMKDWMGALKRWWDRINGTVTTTGSAGAYNYATVNLIMTPQERTGLFLNGNYKLTDNVEAYLSAMHNKTSSAFQLAPDPLTTAGGLVISADSYYNPFGIDYQRGQGSFGTRLVTVGNRRGA